MKKLAILCLVFVWSPILFGQEIARGEQPRVIVVNGQGEASAPPDRAVVRLGATVQNSQANVAQAKVNEIMSKALDSIQKAGVQKKSIGTRGLTLSPIYSNPSRLSSGSEEGPRITGFRASNTLEITLDDTKLVGKVIDAGIEAGANELQGVSFGLKNDLPQRTTALTAAAEEAKSKAQTLAKAMDIQLGRVLEVNESGVRVMADAEYGLRKFAMAAAPGSGGGSPVEPGEVRVQANVTVRYEIGGGAKR
jgi:uncharacterized protein YggE